MSSLNEDAVGKIAKLARLAITKEDSANYAKQLSGILDLVEQMEKVDTENVQPMAHPQEQVQRLRADEVLEPNQRELFQAIAPKVEAGFYLVPKVIE